MNYSMIKSYFQIKSDHGDTCKATCPCHQDREASLSISHKQDKTLLTCHAGCTTRDILEKVGLKMSDLWDQPLQGKSNSFNNNIAAIYQYKDENGKVLYEKVRFNPKRFTQRRSIDGATVWGLDGGTYFQTYTGSNNWSKRERKNSVTREFPKQEPVIYNLPEVIKAVKNKETIFLVEGEKDSDNLVKLGFTATCNFDGASKSVQKQKWRENYNPYFKGANVVLIPDNDGAGRHHMRYIAESLKSYVSTIKMIEFQGMPDKSDISDWLDEGHTKEELLKLIENTKEYTSEDVSIKKEGELPPWYIVSTNSRGEERVSINSGILSRHLINTVHSVYAAEKFYIYDKGSYVKKSDYEAGAIVKKYIEDQYVKSRTITEVVDLWRYEILKKENELNKYQYIINLKNGLLDIEHKEFKEHTENFLSTIQLNTTYDKNAECPIFMKYIAEALEMENVTLIQEILGYLLIPETKAQKFFVLKGRGGTGKSTFLNTVSFLLGQQNISNISWQSLGDRFNTAELYGKLVNEFADLPQTPLEDTGVFKALVGEDFIKGEIKHKGIFYFKNKARLLFSCNEMPANYTDRTDGFYRRFIIIPFDKKPKVIDKDLEVKIQQEINGVFNWALKGLTRLIKNDFTFSENQYTYAALEEYKLQANNVLQFINEECDISEGKACSSSLLYSKYKGYCEDNSLKNVSQPNFKKELLKIPGIDYVQSFRTATTKFRAFTGISLSIQEVKYLNVK
ncbi:phage/plasmid primase, P4 family [Clostridium pasteurianum]|uniref:Phage/plasmid primase, P4 family, C-terminal domain protein n=1 Tax=Clostridium pasteurianum BC1 TaxID=86416 RepID=R4K697_CLOPA|nr:phage/plasmid primase, P4 family [Clostridium pasteurianum]AGK95180.1 phage/plasmid primase, P4 family, C-terminal domain protein [Clostridium pasteurianum BC1]